MLAKPPCKVVLVVNPDAGADFANRESCRLEQPGAGFESCFIEEVSDGSAAFIFEASIEVIERASENSRDLMRG